MFAATHTVQRFRHRRFWWRALWACVLLLHAPLTIKAFAGLCQDGGAPTQGSALLLLGLSNGFFVLEIVFAWGLRILIDRRRVLVFLLIVAFLHAGAIEQAAPQFLRDARLTTLVFVVLLGAMTVREWLRLTRVRFSTVCHDGQITLQHALFRYHCRAGDYRDVRPQQLGLSQDLPRPPPF